MRRGTCRRCPECAGCEHHWQPNDLLGDEWEPDDLTPVDITGNTHVCKHCPAVGDECPDCEGYGEIEDETGLGRTCARCEGAGVIASRPRTFQEAADA